MKTRERTRMTGDEWWRLLPPGTSGDALRVLAARGARAFADGFVALLLPIWLVDLGFNSLAVGVIVASTLIGTSGRGSNADFLNIRCVML